MTVAIAPASAPAQGQATADNAPATGTPAAVVLASSTGSDAGKGAEDTTTQWLAGLDDTSRELATKKSWKGPADVFKSYSDLEKAFSSRAPGAEKPTYKPDDYKFALPANAKDINYSDEFANKFRDLSIAADLSPDQAAKVHDWYTGFASERHQATVADVTAKTATRIAGASADLAKAWGAENNPVYKRNVELAQRAITQLGAMDLLKKSGAVVEHEGQVVVADAAALQAYAKIGAAMYAEDTFAGEGEKGVNPFDPKSEDQRLQSDMIRNDPEKALLLIKTLSPSDQTKWRQVMPSIEARVARGRK